MNTKHQHMLRRRPAHTLWWVPDARALIWESNSRCAFASSPLHASSRILRFAARRIIAVSTSAYRSGKSARAGTPNTTSSPSASRRCGERFLVSYRDRATEYRRVGKRAYDTAERRDRGEKTLAEIGRSYNVSGATISRLMA